MKRFILVAFLSFFAREGFGQSNNFLDIFVGGGCATSNNYDIGLNGGIDFIKGISDRSGIGLMIGYQQYSLYYDNEANSAKHGTGYAGVVERFAAPYAIFAPKFTYAIPRHNLVFYVDAGIAYNVGGYDSLRKWDHSYLTNQTNYISGAVNYDSTIDKSTNINKMMLHFGVGVTEYIFLGKNWWFTMSADFGFIPKSVTMTSDYNEASRTAYSAQKLNPGYISLQIGISHTKRGFK